MNGRLKITWGNHISDNLDDLEITIDDTAVANIPNKFNGFNVVLKDDLEYLEVVGDCNNAISTGKYVISNSANAPCTYGFFDVKNAYNGRWLHQIVTSTSGDIYVRHNTNSEGWTVWVLK